MTGDLRAAVHQHCEKFNAGVRTGDWEPFLETFAEDAEMRFAALPLPPIEGREAIARAYAARPPAEEMAVHEIEDLGGATVAVRFRWASGRDGTMTVRWRDGEVAEIELA